MRRDPGKLEEIRRLDAASVLTSYLDLGPVFSGNVVSLIVRNPSDKAIVISLDDGTTDHLELPPTSSEKIDLGPSGIELDGGTQPQVKLLVAGAATTGVNVSISAVVAKTPSLI
jgi:hypothetical protein